jgi:hypothetical protein
MATKDAAFLTKLKKWDNVRALLAVENNETIREMCGVSQSNWTVKVCVYFVSLVNLSMEWSGVEWSGVEWSGVEWGGVGWNNNVYEHQHI